MSGLSFNLRMAERAVRHVRRVIWRGSGNQASSPADGALCVTYVRETNDYRRQSTADFIPHLSKRAAQIGCGNCGEQAAVAFMHLLGLGVRPLDYMNLYAADGQAVHSFVLIAFAANGERGTSDWGTDAVVCDPWDDGQAYPARELPARMSLYLPGYTVRSLRRDG